NAYRAFTRCWHANQYDIIHIRLSSPSVFGEYFNTQGPFLSTLLQIQKESDPFIPRSGPFLSLVEFSFEIPVFASPVA
ncbi:hypothetical protein L0P46_10545, partial [Collinsella aerofaciens]|nr:hypothetical protein [Collinsella aerofaciens]